MKTKLPLPKTEKFVSNEVIDKLDWPFFVADVYNINFTQSDVDYIKNTIMTHKLYRPIQQISRYHMNSKNEMRAYAEFINFFDMFVNDAKCPKNVKKFLATFVAWRKFEMENDNKTKDLIQTQMISELWMRKCR